MNSEEFRKEYIRSKTIEDALKLIKKLDNKELKNIKDYLQGIKEWFEIDMRANFYLGLIKDEIGLRIKEEVVKNE